jgi:hypothetical protein
MSLSPLNLLASALKLGEAEAPRSVSSDFNLAMAGATDTSAVTGTMREIENRLGALGDRSGWMMKKGDGEAKSVELQLGDARFAVVQATKLSPQALEAIGKDVKQLEQLVEKNPNPTQDVVNQAARLIDGIEAKAAGGAPDLGSLVPNPPSNPTNPIGGVPPLVGVPSSGGEDVIKAFDAFGDAKFRRGGEYNFSNLDAYDAFTRRFSGVEKAMKAEQQAGDLSAEDQTFLKGALDEMRSAWNGKPNDEKLFGILGRMEDRLNIAPPTGAPVLS